MTASHRRTSARRIPWCFLLVAATVAGVTQVPYVLGARWAPAGTVYDGLVGMTDDQNMYYSFIRQSTEGHWLFINRLTHIDHRPFLLNVEWLAVGRLIGWLNGSQAGAYAIWRVLGIGLLLAGFSCVGRAIGLDRFQRCLALWLCAFGGGFGWMLLVLERSGLIPHFPLATLDLSDAIHPFSHMFASPHLAISHGLSLLFLASFAAGEQSEKPRWYAIAGMIAALHGLIRPYDLILIYGVIPLFVLTERVVTREWSWRKTALRLLPLLVSAPVLGYCVALFRFHPVFKYWASQGDVKAIGIHWDLFSFGLAGALCLVRICLARKYPFRSSAERLLAVWIAGVLFVMHGKNLPGLGFMPYSRVFGVTLPSVMLILGVRVLDQLTRAFARDRAWQRMGLLAVLLTGNSLGSAVWILKISHNLAHMPDHYVDLSEHEAHAWLDQHAQSSDIVLSTLVSGNRMARYVSCRFVIGHWSVTPHVKDLTVRTDRYYRGEMTEADEARFLDNLNVRWIYVGRLERQLGMVDLPAIRGIVPRYKHGQVQIFSYTTTNTD